MPDTMSHVYKVSYSTKTETEISDCHIIKVISASYYEMEGDRPKNMKDFLSEVQRFLIRNEYCEAIPEINLHVASVKYIGYSYL